MGFEASISATNSSLFNPIFFNFSAEIHPASKIPTIPSSYLTLPSNHPHSYNPRKSPPTTITSAFSPSTILYKTPMENAAKVHVLCGLESQNLQFGVLELRASSVANAQIEEEQVGVKVEEQVEAEVAKGYTMTQFCDKIIDLFLNEKPKTKEWRKYLVFREEWKKYRDSFYKRCQSRAKAENDSQMKQKLIGLSGKVKKIDDEMERHSELLKELQDSPTDVNAIVTQRRKDFTEDFFRYLTLLSETNDSLEDRDAVARLGARCLSAVSAFDNTLEIVDTLDTAQAKFDDILSSPSMDVACDKIKSLAKAKALDSSLILLINSAWAAAKESSTMSNEVCYCWKMNVDVPARLSLKSDCGGSRNLRSNPSFIQAGQSRAGVKDIMYQLYKATKSSLRSIAPKEIKLLKYLLNITDPEERFSAMATAFCPGDERDVKDQDVIYTTPKELHKWVKIMLDAYHLNKEETDIREAKRMSQPIVMQRLFIIMETIEEEYLAKRVKTENDSESEEL
ncbi:hypothetical protein RHSIM_Rhsim04G0250200 [Rhododendron simsii]|uniref:Uncharacterized protein n=1 Tax=Rhododendron simsii TaxID=118357 RepID=A0A834LND7_RHOSS|nr:hypothetical protein RHSIM_Rhsim04G0250200 [Rhododendron simsii]